MDFEEYRKHDAVGLAGLVSKGEVTPPELLEVAVSRMAAVDPKINAVTLEPHSPRGRPKGGRPVISGAGRWLACRSC